MSMGHRPISPLELDEAGNAQLIGGHESPARRSSTPELDDEVTRPDRDNRYLMKRFFSRQWASAIIVEWSALPGS